MYNSWHNSNGIQKLFVFLFSPPYIFFFLKKVSWAKLEGACLWLFSEQRHHDVIRRFTMIQNEAQSVRPPGHPLLSTALHLTPGHRFSKAMLRAEA